MARKKDLCRASNGLFVRNLGWKQSLTGYSQHKFYLEQARRIKVNKADHDREKIIDSMQKSEDESKKAAADLAERKITPEEFLEKQRQYEEIRKAQQTVRKDPRGRADD
jgi:hypothetical protein